MEFFSSLPNIMHANKLNQLVRQTICQKLALIIQQISEQINLDFTTELKGFVEPKTNQNYSVNPSLFFYYFQLKEAIATGDLNTILDIVNLIFQERKFLMLENDISKRINTAITSEWELQAITNYARNDQISEFGMRNKFEIIRPIFYSELEKQKKYVMEALSILKLSDTTHYHAITENLNAIKLFTGTVRAFSFQAIHGNIYIRCPEKSDDPTAYYLEHIVHECAHQHLFALQLIDPVVLNKSHELFPAPIRKQKRPMNGIFHACFVLARMMHCFRKLDGHLDAKTNDEFLNRIQGWFNSSYQTVKEHAKLSDKGKEIFSTLPECAYG
ncbi:aKG-HExxH-type peptide beta-hydroxylase [Cysteiniphilum litorale]|uniref:aKG-HExxH-type peptide beta-hydroxylase n=1 Tax=Cysteiniphilum litorale TaxID=2056700 RepID=UPI003F88315B